MLVENGQALLAAYAENNFQEVVENVAPGVWHVVGLGHSNATIIEGERGVILVDCLETAERGERLRALVTERTGKTVHTICYTHGHPDHRGGAGAFAETVQEIIAFAPKTAPYQRSEQLNALFMERATKQFGYALSDEEALTQGLGNREGIVYGETRAMLAPTTLYDSDAETRVIDGVTLVLRRLVGEADDQMMIWLPETRVLCCGDNYYGCFPNLYAIRGGQYRDIAAWVESLDVLRAYPAEHLLAGHTPAVHGRAQVAEVLGRFRDAIDWILAETLTGINAGETADALAARIRLPEKYAALPFLGEHYGCVEWTVRAIFAAYVGWFDGNPTHLHPLAPAAHAEKMLALAGGWEKVAQAAQDAFAKGDHQWCLELCDLLLAVRDEQHVAFLKADAMDALARLETSANGRHYYLACAKELRATH